MVHPNVAAAAQRCGSPAKHTERTRLLWCDTVRLCAAAGTLQIVLNASLLFYYIGISSTVGIIMLFCLIPLNRVLVGMQMKLRFSTQKFVDERVQIGLGRSVASHHRSSTLHQICLHIRCLYF